MTLRCSDIFAQQKLPNKNALREQAKVLYSVGETIIFPKNVSERRTPTTTGNRTESLANTDFFQYRGIAAVTYPRSLGAYTAASVVTSCPA